MMRVARTQLNEYRYFMMLSTVVVLYAFGVNLIGSQVYSMIYRVTAVLTNPSVKRRFLSWPFVALCQLLMLAATAGLSYAIHIATVRDTDELYDGRDLGAEKTRNAAGEWIWIHRVRAKKLQ
ncbi:hypothetical protein AAVH_20138 [Aphelenchoides avenae]|nr:hypothetical protein AAVH_20138 [Aphelenchus avenae]